jgi:hypothetical protein
MSPPETKSEQGLDHQAGNEDGTEESKTKGGDDNEDQ